MSLERALDFIDEDELVEITPKTIRMRKKILDSTQRYRAARKSTSIRTATGVTPRRPPPQGGRAPGGPCVLDGRMGLDTVMLV